MSGKKQGQVLSLYPLTFLLFFRSYDPEGLRQGDTRWPDWLCDKSFTHMLPQKVYPPGYPVARVNLSFFESIGVRVPSSCVVCSGTTDSIAAFVAADCSEEGEAY